MRLLLTSAGIRNKSIETALVDLMGKPIAESAALCIPTAGYGSSYGTPARWRRFVSGEDRDCPMTGVGWGSVGLLELTALPTLERERWRGWVEEADVLLANGGDALYLAHWMRASGLVDLLPSLADKTWVGFSAGSMVMTPRIGRDFVVWQPPTGGDAALGLVDFAIFPHVDHPQLPENTMEAADRWAADLGLPAYAIDDETAIRVDDGRVDVVTEGHWKQYDAAPHDTSG